MHFVPFGVRRLRTLRFLPPILGTALLTALIATSAYAQELIPSNPSGWTGFAPRSESAPGLLASMEGSGYTLQIDGNSVASVYGGWRTRIQGLAGNQHYRFRARVAASGVASPREQVTILIRWRGSFGDIVAPDYVWEYRAQSDGSLLFERILQAPPGTNAADVELVLQWAPNGRLRFDGLSFVPSAAPQPRPVKAVAVHYRPQGTTSGPQSVQRAVAHGQQIAAAQAPDVMVFGELLNVIGAPGSFDQKAETIPGPSTDAMADLARTYRTYVAFGMLEREGNLLYNAAVLFDRSGAIVAKYRKMQLPLSDVASGITPGDRVPVFQTDFGRVALLICQDTAFPEPVREAAIQGAEMLLVPIWGGKASVMSTRAIEHSLYVVASGYDYLTEVLDPIGSALDRVDTLWEPGAAVALLDLNRRYREDWSGDWRDLVNKQRRRIPSPYTANDTTPDAGTSVPPPANVPPTVTLTSPAAGATFTAPAIVNMTAAAADSDGTISRVDFYNGSALIGSDVTAPYTFVWENVAAGTYTLSARAADNVGASSVSGTVTVTVSPGTATDPTLPAPWQTQDIGAVGAVGSARVDAGTFTIEGAGADIWGSADAFRYVYQPINGDIDVVARVASMEYVHAWVKAGVMIRERLTPDSPHALMLVSPGKGLAFQRRTATAGLTTSTSGGAGTAPAWVKLERRGNTIAAYRSADGVTWALVGSDTFAMPSTVYVGLAVSSHVSGDLATVTFDTVSVTSSSGLPSPWRSQDVGAVGVVGSASAAAGTFTVRGSGADVWGTADAMHYVWQPLSGDADVVTRVASVDNVHAWVKAGVMIRERLTADSPHAFLLVSPGRGLAFQRRVAGGGISTSTSGIAGVAPKWVKLERRGNVISAFWSDDGATWHFVASDAFTMAGDVHVGLAVTSHDNARLATATFDNVVVR